MTTAREIVSRAFRKANIGGVGEGLVAEYADEGLDALNMMLAEWKLRSVDISHTELALDDDFPLTAEFERGTVYLLAAEISPNYSVPRQFDRDEFFRSIQASYMTISEVTMPNALVKVPSRLHRGGTVDAS